MYSALWRALPGPAWLRVILLLILAVGVLALCAFWIFPFIDQFIASQEVTVET